MSSLLWLIPFAVLLVCLRVRRELVKLRRDGIVSPLTGPSSRGLLARWRRRRAYGGSIR